MRAVLKPGLDPGRVEPVSTDWLTLHPTDPVWIAVALVLGMLAAALRVPALVGFLAAGFLFNALGAEAGAFISEAADLGITLLLFTIGLHLSVRMFARPQVWAVAIGHITISSLLIGLLVVAGSALGVGVLAELGVPGALALGIALSFSSTVFTFKVLQERGARRTHHGRVAMGVLIIQDLVAVALLVASTKHWPSPWAAVLLALPALRRPLLWVMGRCGHGELLILFGIVAAMAGAGLFEAVGLKADLGALAFGLLLSGTERSDELSRSLEGFKDLFLVGFFVSVGLTVPLEIGPIVVGMLLVAIVPAKAGLFMLLFSRAKLRARTAWQASLDLGTFSEFGLIVVAAAVASGLLPADVQAATAVAVGLSLVVAAPVAASGDLLYLRARGMLRRLQRPERLAGDEDLHLRPTEVVVFGLGRVGTAALNAVEADFPDRVLGVDVSPRVVAEQVAAGHYCVVGDATDPEFWSRTEGLVHRLSWVLLAMASHAANVAAVAQLRARGFTGRVVATARYPDQAEHLRELGVDLVFDIYAEAGAGFASDLHARFDRPQQ